MRRAFTRAIVMEVRALLYCSRALLPLKPLMLPGMALPILNPAEFSLVHTCCDLQPCLSSVVPSAARLGCMKSWASSAGLEESWK